MNNKTTIFIISLIVGIVTYLLWNTYSTMPPKRSIGKNQEKQGNQEQVSSDSSPQADEPEFDYMSVLSESEQAHVKSTGYVFTKDDIEKIKRKKLGKDIQSLIPTLEEYAAMADTPVEFYGQVLDQFDQPVVGAKIRCSWEFMGPQHSARQLESSPSGQFEITELRAISITVFVYPPPGYDESVSDTKEIQIAKAPERVLADENYKKFSLELKKSLERKLGLEEAYKGDKTKPVIFRLERL